MSDAIAIGWFGPTNDRWNWILGHFRDVTLLTDRNVEDWLASQSKASVSDRAASPAALLIAIEARFDPAIDFARRLEQTVAPTDVKNLAVPWCVLLGDDWVGHRRTYPLPETLQTFYWYELYDRVLPWLVSLSQVAPAVHSTDTSRLASQRRVSPRVQRLIEASLSIDRRLHDIPTANSIKMAMIVAETATTRQLWCEAFSRHAIQCIATTPENLELWAKPEIIVVDLEPEPLVRREFQLAQENGGARGCLVRKLAHQFPEATVIVGDAFPRWDTWKTLKECGADLVVAKPFQFSGVLDTLLHCQLNS